MCKGLAAFRLCLTALSRGYTQVGNKHPSTRSHRCCQAGVRRTARMVGVPLLLWANSVGRPLSVRPALYRPCIHFLARPLRRRRRREATCPRSRSCTGLGTIWRGEVNPLAVHRSWTLTDPRWGPRNGTCSKRGGRGKAIPVLPAEHAARLSQVAYGRIRVAPQGESGSGVAAPRRDGEAGPGARGQPTLTSRAPQTAGQRRACSGRCGGGRQVTVTANA
jgi:hypothetical protein